MSSAAFRLCLVLLSAALYAALSTSAGGWLAWIALCPLLFACASSTPRTAFGLGIAFGLAATIGVAWWFPGMLERYFAAGPGLAWLSLLAVGATVDGVPYGLFAAGVALAARRRLASPLLVGCGFGLAELLRSHGPLANPFGLLGYSLRDTPLAQAADLAGPIGLGVLVVTVSAAVTAQLAPGLARRPRRALAWSAIAALSVLAYGEWSLTRSFGVGRPVRVALVQGAVSRGLHWDRALRDANLARYLELNELAARGRPELVFWPEFAIDFYLSEPTVERARLLDGVRAGGADVVLGASRYVFAPQGTEYFNSVFVIDRAGNVGPVGYDKQRLVPFSEYAPLGSVLRADSAVYVAGSEPRWLETTAGRVGAFVCGEALYPEVARGLARAGAEILANPSNDYWFGAPEAAAQQLASARFRALENRRYLVRATATGVSAVIDPHGRVSAQSLGDGPEVIAAELRRSHAVTLYQRLGEGGVALLCLVSLALALVGARRNSLSQGGSA
ncbi:MAG TPA: apolipoprotein N-acyltransferase [Myxococcota bacterium]|nr:apolipoprotein N-acyltransferase [Myxococcota bacterium]